MKRTLLLLTLTLLFNINAWAQTPAKPEENARLKPMVTELTSAQEALNAKLVLSPEAKAVNEAKAVYDRAVAALDEARKKLPEYQRALTAEAKVLDEIYRAMAAHGLSSREYRPILSDKGELAFVRIEPAPKP